MTSSTRVYAAAGVATKQATMATTETIMKILNIGGILFNGFLHIRGCTSLMSEFHCLPSCQSNEPIACPPTMGSNQFHHRRLFMQSKPATHLAAALACASTALPLIHAQDTTHSEDASWYSSLPEGAERPSDSTGMPVTPAVTSEFSGPIPTNDWWTSLLWRRYPGSTLGQAMFPHPLAFHGSSNGLNVLRPTHVHQSDVAYFNVIGSAQAALTIGVEGMSVDEVNVLSESDWIVTSDWTDASRTLRTTFGHGLPYVFAQAIGGRAVVDPNEALGEFTLLSNNEFEAIFEVGGAVYGAYGPPGSSWTYQNGQLLCDTTDDQWIAVGALPDDSFATQTLFRDHAHARVTNTTVAWSVDEQTSTLQTSFTFDAQDATGATATPLIAMFRHQWMSSNEPTLPQTYSTVRGEMRIAATSSFSCERPLTGYIPAFPDAGQYDRGRVDGYLNDALSSGDMVTAQDSYWSGKQLGRVAQLVHIADQRGNIEARDRLLGELREDLEDWLSVSSPDESGSSAFDTIEAEHGAASGSTGNNGSAVTGIGDGDSIAFADLDFGGNDATRVLVRIASGAGAGGSAMVRLRLDTADGPILAEGAVGNTGGWESWNEIPFAISSSVMAMIEGPRTIVFECSTGYPSDLFNLDWVRFEHAGGGNDSGSDPRFLAYDSTWNTMLAYPGSYGSLDELNDHHFHYSYFISAAATIAQFDPTWASRWGGAIEMLIKDTANWDRSDERFPFLRNFDPYMGYAYASGHQGFANGNNQESSSESINFDAALIHWGSVTGNDAIRDLGFYLHTVESAAIHQYWFDADEEVFPESFPHPLLGIVWNNGGDYATWWTANPEEIHGINLLPITTGSLHLGTRPDVIQRNYDYLLERNGGPPTVWQDIHWMALAMADGDAALNTFDSQPSVGSEAGESKAHTYHWLASLATFGRVAPDVHADSPFAITFERSDTGARTHIAWNPSSQPRTVLFTDGTAGCVEPGETRVLEGSDGCTIAMGDLNGDGVVDGSDLGLLLAAWGTTRPGADLNGDGTVNGADLGLLLASW